MQRQTINHLGTLFRLLHYETLYEVYEVFAICLVQLYNHAHINKCYLYILIELFLQSRGLLFLSFALQVQILKKFR